MKRLAKSVVNSVLGPLGLKVVRKRRADHQWSASRAVMETTIDLGGRRPSPLMERADMTLREWSFYHSASILGVPHSEEDERGPIRMTYFGIPMRKNPLDLWVCHEIIHEVKPDLIIEIGSAHGGSTLWLAHQLDLLGNPDAKVLSLDINRDPYVASHPRIIEFTGDSSSPEIVEQVRPHAAAAKTVLALHDGAHWADYVIRDLRAYGDMVTPGSYFIVEDGLGDLKKTWGMSQYDDTGGPLNATLEFLDERADYEIDYERERYLLTQNNLGFLRRKG